MTKKIKLPTSFELDEVSKENVAKKNGREGVKWKIR
jgi:hypothetical protein